MRGYEINEKRALNTFLDLVKIPSPSFQEMEVGKYIDEKMKSLGMETIWQTYRTEFEGESVESFNLIGVMKRNTEIAEPVFFSAHLDTVSPCKNVKPQTDGDIIKSDGTTILGADDKIGITAILEALETANEKNIPHGDIYAVFTSAEEAGLVGAKHLDASLIKAKKGYVLDAEGEVGEIITSSPSHIRYSVRFSGKSAHAGIEVENGINAVLMASEFALSVPSGKIADDVVANVGKIMGGTATNIVPENAIVEGEYRSHREKPLEEIRDQIEKTASEIAAKYGGKVKVNQELLYRAFRFKDDSLLVKWFREACENMGLEFSAKHSNGGSDASIMNEKGLEAVLVASAMRQVHSKSEWVKISDIVKLSQLVLQIIKTIASK